MIQSNDTKKEAEGRIEYYGYGEGKQDEKSSINNHMGRTFKTSNGWKTIESKDSDRNKVNKKFNQKWQTGSLFSSSVSVSSRFKDRLDKVCSTFNEGDFKKEIFLLKRQIERLEKQLFRKDKIILEIKNQTYDTRQIQIEIIQAYRAVHYFEGKIKEMEFEIEKFRQLIQINLAEQIKEKDLSLLFDELRKQNQDLSAKLQQQEYEIYLKDEKYRRLSSKMFQLKKQFNKMYKKFPDGNQQNWSQRLERMFEIIQAEKPIQHKEHLYFQKVTENLKTLSKDLEISKNEVDKLNNELQQKNNQITALYKENFSLQKRHRSQKSQLLPRTPLQENKQIRSRDN